MSGSLVPVDFVSSLPATKEDLKYLSEQRQMLRDFVAKELRDGSDYGVIPGTPKPSLYKPGAEKLKVLFKLGFNTVLTRDVIDPKNNLAVFFYKTQIYRLVDPAVMLGECEASCNSQEKKYRERTVYDNRTNQKSKEPTPIYDILNTLQKMAQKRAFVGAIIISVGASDFFTQDIDDPNDAQQLGTQPKIVNANATIPGVQNTTSADQTQTGNPPCPSCGAPMGISKYPNPNTGDIDFYCFKCKIKKVRP